MIKSRWEGISGGDARRGRRRRSSSPRSTEGARVSSSEPEAARSGAGPIAPEFAVLGVEVVRGRRGAHAALPRSACRSRRGREIFTIALTAQINIEPARRDLRRRDARAARRPLRRARALGRRRPTSFLWAHVDALVPSFTGADDVHARPCRARTTSRWPPRKYFSSLPDGEVPLAVPLQRLGPLPRRRRPRCRSCSVPWTLHGALAHAGRDMARDDGRHYPGGGWVRLQRTRSTRLRAAHGRSAALHSLRRTP